MKTPAEIVITGYRVEGCPVEELNGLYVPACITGGEQGKWTNGAGNLKWFKPTRDWGGGFDLMTPGYLHYFMYADDPNGKWKPEKGRTPKAMKMKLVRLRCVEIADDLKGEE